MLPRLRKNAWRGADQVFMWKEEEEEEEEGRTLQDERKRLMLLGGFALPLNDAHGLRPDLAGCDNADADARVRRPAGRQAP